MTQAERVLDYLWSVAPNGATNGELALRLGIRSHQTVYMLTQQLMYQGRIRASRSGPTWVFHVAEDSGTMLGTGPAWTNATTLAARFETLARGILSDRYAVELRPGSVPGIPTVFHFVSPDHRVVGDAKYFSVVVNGYLEQLLQRFVADCIDELLHVLIAVARFGTWNLQIAARLGFVDRLETLT